MTSEHAVFFKSSAAVWDPGLAALSASSWCWQRWWWWSAWWRSVDTTEWPWCQHTPRPSSTSSRTLVRNHGSTCTWVHYGLLHSMGTLWSVTQHGYTMVCYTAWANNGLLHSMGAQWSVTQHGYTMVCYIEWVHNGLLHSMGTQWSVT